MKPPGLPSRCSGTTKSRRIFCGSSMAWDFRVLFPDEGHILDNDILAGLELLKPGAYFPKRHMLQGIPLGHDPRQRTTHAYC